MLRRWVINDKRNYFCACQMGNAQLDHFSGNQFADFVRFQNPFLASDLGSEMANTMSCDLEDCCSDVWKHINVGCWLCYNTKNS